MDHCHINHIQQNAQVIVPTAVLIASFLGSGHCVAMCGGLIAAGAKSAVNILIYHVGRLISYVGLGILFGFAGEGVQKYFSGPSSWVVAVLMGLGFIVLGVYSWNGAAHPPLPAKLQALIMKVSGSLLARSSRPEANIYAGLLGAFSIFLPCGWLYGFALASAASQNPWIGAVTMFFFWLGSVPALTVLPWLFQRFLGPLRKWSPQISAGMLILIGLVTIVIKFLPHAKH